MAFKDQDPVHNKAATDEPIFTLRAQDQLAPSIVRKWAIAAREAGSPVPKVQEAYECAAAMEAWQNANTCKVPD